MPYDSSSYLDPALTMNPVSQSSSSPGGKSLNAASSHNPVQQQQGQTTSPGFESNTRRSGSYSSGIPSAAAARNNQMQRKQHKNSKKPKLAVEDNMEESVSSIPTRSRRLSVLIFLDGREKRKQSSRASFNYSSYELCSSSQAARLSKHNPKRYKTWKYIWNWIWSSLQ